MRFGRHCQFVAGATMIVALGMGTMACRAESAAGAAEPAAPASAAASAIDPAAMDALKRMGAYLRTLKTFTIHVATSTEQVLDDGQKLQFEGKIDYRVKTPQGLRADVLSDQQQRAFYYNGKSLTLYAPRVKYYTSVDAPPTISALVTELGDKFGIELPLADLFFWGTDKDNTQAIQSALDIGPSRVGGVACEQYAFRQADVDWQVWIKAGAQPLPIKIVITATDDQAMPQYVGQLTWNTKAQIDDKVFNFVAGKDDRRIALKAAAAN